MIEFIKGLSWPILVLLWVLIGLLWSDFLLWFTHRFAPDVEVSRTVKNMTVVLWPLSIAMFVFGTIMGIIKFFTRR